MAEIKAQLHSNDFAAAMATEATLAALWPGTHLKKSVDKPEEAIDLDDKGLATIITSNPAYVRFACERQGYVQKVF